MRDMSRFDLSKMNKLVIPHEHLNETLQGIINGEFRISGRGLSDFRNITNLASSFPIVPIIGYNLANDPGTKAWYAGLAAVNATQILFLRKKSGEIIRDFYKVINNQLLARNLFSTKAEGYPTYFYNPNFIQRLEKNMPVFYVNMKGGIIFLKESNSEYLRYRLQKLGIIRFAGLNPWYWRGYLRPPKAPAKVKRGIRELLSRRFRRAQPVNIAKTSRIKPKHKVPK